MEHEFRRSPEGRRRGRSALLSGLFGLAIGGLMFLSELRTPPEESAEFIRWMTVAVISASAISLLAAHNLLRTPSRIVVGDRELLLEGFLRSRRLPWAQIARLERDKGFEGYPELVAEIETRSHAATGHATYDRTAELSRKLRAQRRERRLLGTLSVCFLAGGVFLAWEGLDQLIEAAALRTEGSVTRARVVRHYLHNVTPRLEYEFQDPSGRIQKRNVAVARVVWEALKDAQQVPVVYLASDPRRSRLAGGEVDVGSSPGLNLAVGLLVILMGGAGLLLIAKGYVGLDSKAGKIRFVRFGEVDDQLEGPISSDKRR